MKSLSNPQPRQASEEEKDNVLAWLIDFVCAIADQDEASNAALLAYTGGTPKLGTAGTAVWGQA